MENAEQFGPYPARSHAHCSNRWGFAEPCYAVTQPSNLLVMENVARADAKGKFEEIDAK
jgi:hypothetical protein